MRVYHEQRDNNSSEGATKKHGGHETASAPQLQASPDALTFPLSHFPTFPLSHFPAFPLSHFPLPFRSCARSFSSRWSFGPTSPFTLLRRRSLKFFRNMWIAKAATPSRPVS